MAGDDTLSPDDTGIDLDTDPEELSDREFADQLTRISGKLGEIEVDAQDVEFSTSRLARLRRKLLGMNEREKAMRERSREIEKLISRAVDLRKTIPERFPDTDDHDQGHGFY